MWHLIVELARVLVVAVDTGRRLPCLIKLGADASVHARLRPWVERLCPPLVLHRLQSFVRKRGRRANDHTLAEAACQGARGGAALAARIRRIMRLAVRDRTLLVMLYVFPAADSCHSLRNC